MRGSRAPDHGIPLAGAWLLVWKQMSSARCSLYVQGDTAQVHQESRPPEDGASGRPLDSAERADDSGVEMSRGTNEIMQGELTTCCSRCFRYSRCHFWLTVPTRLQDTMRCRPWQGFHDAHKSSVSKDRVGARYGLGLCRETGLGDAPQCSLRSDPDNGCTTA